VIAHALTHGVTQYTVPGGGLVYDDFTYTLTVDGKQVRFHVDAAPAALRELVEILEARPPD
jgi:hypothetical protein